MCFRLLECGISWDLGNVCLLQGYLCLAEEADVVDDLSTCGIVELANQIMADIKELRLERCRTNTHIQDTILDLNTAGKLRYRWS